VLKVGFLSWDLNAFIAACKGCGINIMFFRNLGIIRGIRQLQGSKSGINIFRGDGDINFQSRRVCGGLSDRSAGTLGPPRTLL
jgi:hypothetical protein